MSDKAEQHQPLQVVVLTGMAGSGKSVALHALEDIGFYCVDNLPPELLPALVSLEPWQHGNRIAIAVDARSAKALYLVPAQLEKLRAAGAQVQLIYLDAQRDILIRRFSETRRRHPLTNETLQEGPRALVQMIDEERALLADLREQAHVIDTSNIRVAQLQAYIKQIMKAPASSLTLVFQSFGFKNGIPMDSDFMFDVRMLPNPYYEPDLRSNSGLEAPVAEFLAQQPAVQKMRVDIIRFLDNWLPEMLNNHRSYATVSIGCTGGQHRSVYLVNALAQHFQAQWTTLQRHRELDKKSM
ncbi:RNase adapter RapZ [Comamonas sp. J-3]|uniref:RNase adapter RapZ n=1 Tax=Comamonas trifloxystrobinivorans TaxID=3350256 RepID=UPI00372C55B1